MCLCACASVHVCVDVCVCVCVCVCASVWTCICARLCVSVYMRACMHVSKHFCVYVRKWERWIRTKKKPSEVQTKSKLVEWYKWQRIMVPSPQETMLRRSCSKGFWSAFREPGKTTVAVLQDEPKCQMFILCDLCDSMRSMIFNLCELNMLMLYCSDKRYFMKQYWILNHDFFSRSRMKSIKINSFPLQFICLGGIDSFL